MIDGMKKKKHTKFSNRYRKIGKSMLAAAYRLRAGVAFTYNEYPGLLEEITRSLSGRILDVGTAGGWLVDYLRKRKRNPYGIDTDIEHMHGKHLAAGTAGALPFKDESFDGVFSGFCLSYIDDKDSALSEMARVLVPLGDLVMLIHHPESGIREEHKKYLRFYEDNEAEIATKPEHIKQYTLSSAFIAGMVEDEDDLRGTVVKNGFRIKTLRRQEGRKGHLFSSFIMKDIPVRKVFWLMRATRELNDN